MSYNSAIRLVGLKSNGGWAAFLSEAPEESSFSCLFWFLEVAIVGILSLQLLPLSSHVFPAILAKIGLASPLGTPH